MVHIDIQRTHTLNHDQAREAAANVAAHLNEKFDINYHWEGDSLHFERSGVSGHIDVYESDVRIRVRLGFLLLPMKHHFEQAIHRYIDELFAKG
jgi:putative polyhydroxyalkanoate system protein